MQERQTGWVQLGGLLHDPRPILSYLSFLRYPGGHTTPGHRRLHWVRACQLVMDTGKTIILRFHIVNETLIRCQRLHGPYVM